MTDLDHDDERFELASAYVDGALDPAERARAESDPSVMALVDDFRRLQDDLAAPVAVDPADRDAAVAAAMQAFGSPRSAPVTELSTRRRRQRVLSLLAAAAAVALVAIGITRLNPGNSDDSADLSASAAPQLERTDAPSVASGSATADATTTMAAAGGAATTAAAAARPEAAVTAPLPDLGSADNLDAAAGLLARQPSLTQTPPPANATGPRCARSDQVVATLVYRGQRALVHVAAAADGRRSATIVAEQTCEVLGQFVLP